MFRVVTEWMANGRLSHTRSDSSIKEIQNLALTGFFDSQIYVFTPI